MVETKKNQSYTLTYGQDHIEGLFYKIVSYDGVVMDEDSQDSNPDLTMRDVAVVAEEYGFDLSDEVEEEEIEYD